MKRLAVPLILLTVIVLAWLIQSSLEKKSIRGKTIENFLELNANDIDKIVINTKRDTLCFLLDAGRWFLEDSLPRRADSMAIGNMIATATDMKVGSVISQNPERQVDFMVDTLSGNLVQFYRDDRLLSSIIIGKMARDYAHTYIRKPGSNEVYVAEGPLTYVFSRKRTQWLDKTILSLSPQILASVEFVYPDKGKAYKIFRHHSLWYVSKRPYKDSIIADSMKIDAFIGQLSRLNANDFINATDSGLIDFEELSLTLNVSLADGSVHTLNFGRVNEEGNRVYCRKPELEETFVVYKSRFQNLKKEFSGFLP